MEWRQDFSVQVPALDKDHQILAGCVTEIEQAVAKGQTSSIVNSAIRQLIKLARTHFNQEVDLMRIRDYPGIGAHIKDHKAFLAELEALERKSLAGRLSNETVEFLHTWLEQHLLSYDKDYASYFSESARPAEEE